MRDVTKVYVKGLFALLFIVYYGCIHICTHVHVEDGTPVVHAHPFKKMLTDPAIIMLLRLNFVYSMNFLLYK
ncbi:MAG: hypothetical protein LIP04_04030 [Tannerellaceae bacterium]|nr:hypothetical protein [Tannerellaceae bacterium]